MLDRRGPRVHNVSKSQDRWLTKWLAVFCSNVDCPYCVNMRPSKSTSLQTLYPEIAQEWDQEKNAVTADLCSAKSRLEVWWKCKNGHLWSESVRNRTVDHSCCPLCRDKGSVSLSQRCRQLLRHWDYQKNDTPPNTVSIGTSRKYFWKCERCHRSFQAPVNGVVTTFFEGKDAEGHETKGNRVYAESVI